MTGKQKRLLCRILAGAAALLGGVVTLHTDCPLWVYAPLFALSYGTVGWDILRKAALGVLHGRMFDENFLMSLATVGAILLALWEKSFDFSEAVTVMLLYQVGELFQSIAVGKSRKSIGALMDIRPDLATLEEGDGRRQVAPEEVAVGSVIVIEPGERVPLDGVVLSGESTLDTRALTGESIPRPVRPGETVQSGCINVSGLLRVRTTGLYGESTVARILALVEEASSRKSRSEAFISRFARIYTPSVCIAALLLAVGAPLVSLLAGEDPAWQTRIAGALSFLVISCPCALVISIPLGFFAGIGGAGHAGILIKGSNYLEMLAKADTVAFDKTGTLTRGVFAVTDVCPQGVTKEELLSLAAGAEAYSSHPIAKSICEAAGKAAIPAERVTEQGGKGVVALLAGREVAVGNQRLMTDLRIDFPAPEAAGTAVLVAIDGRFAGFITISDVVKPDSRTALEELRRVGVTRTVLLTGDSRAAAESVGKELQIDEIRCELLPDGKVEALEKLMQKQSAGHALLFVGDGINDAPSLMRADVGIAMGALGSDAAIEAADVVLMDDDPRKVAAAIRLSRKCLAIVRENVAFTLSVKFLCLLLSALGLAGMWLAIFADVGVMVLAVLNALRAMRV